MDNNCDNRTAGGPGAAPKSIALTQDGGAVRIIDQTRLPGALVTLELRSREAFYEAIASLRVRGAPAIGVFAALALAVLCRDYGEEEFLPRLEGDAAYLVSCRPTAVNLARQADRLLARARALAGACPGAAALREALRAEALSIQREEEERSLAIARHGLSLLRPGDTVLTHCNAGPLAAGGYGTALGPLLLAAERGVELHALVDETRPLLQGARLTAWELLRAGVDTTLICDSMAALAMAQGRVQAALFGCDRMARNGDAANKIGTAGAAILAKYYGVPVYFLLPASTVDFSCADGGDIPIELRDESEIRSLWYETPMAPAGVKCWNPAFDVTDHSLITAIVTERGVLYPPFDEGLRALYGGEA